MRRKARANNPKLGFTKCATLEANGAPQCAACKYRQYDRSPLNTPEANEVAKVATFQQGDVDAHYGLIPEAIGTESHYQPIPGGYHDASDENIARLNRRICRVVKGSETLFYENMGPGGHQWRRQQAVEAAWAGAHVNVTRESDKGAKARSVPLYRWYMEHTGKLPPALPVFKPQEKPGHIGSNEYNMWSGWGVQPDPSYDINDPDSGVRIITDHIRDILCRSQRDRFYYVMGWFAWKVQHPEQPCETAMVFRSGPEGTGKNIVLNMYTSLFGAHGAVFGDKRSVTGEHATNEYLSFALINEALFHGDKQTTDQMKSLITEDTRVINPQFQDIRVIKNMCGFIILSNHSIVVTLGSHARRHVIFDVDESRIDDFAYFERLKAAINNGGAGQFLHFLMHASVKTWHPRRIIHTEETKLHQLAGMGATMKWLLDSSATGKLLGDLGEQGKSYSCRNSYTYIVDDGSGGLRYQTDETVPLDHYVPTDTLFAMHLGWAKSTRARDLDALNTIEFGRRMTEVLGPHARPSVAKGSSCGSVVRNPSSGQAVNDRPWSYKVPDADALRERVYKAWGVKQRK
jgi:hypothetical protein